MRISLSKKKCLSRYGYQNHFSMSLFFFWRYRPTRLNEWVGNMLISVLCRCRSSMFVITNPKKLVPRAKQKAVLRYMHRKNECRRVYKQRTTWNSHSMFYRSPLMELVQLSSLVPRTRCPWLSKSLTIWRNCAITAAFYVILPHSRHANHSGRGSKKRASSFAPRKNAICQDRELAPFKAENKRPRSGIDKNGTLTDTAAWSSLELNSMMVIYIAAVIIFLTFNLNFVKNYCSR